MNKLRILFSVLAGVLFFTLADGLTAEAAETSAYDTWWEYYEAALEYADTKSGYSYSYIAMYYNADNFYFCYSGTPIYYLYSYGIGSDSAFCIITIPIDDLSTIGWGVTNYFNITNNNCSFIASNCDLYYGSTLKYSADPDFFLVTPRLGKIVEANWTEMTEIRREILTMIPLLVPLLAGYLGLRKALRWLSAILRTA